MEDRQIELLAYAKVCFDKCTSPFETAHLAKKKVSATECRTLSFVIAEIIEDYLELMNPSETVQEAIKKAEEDFAETQK